MSALWHELGQASRVGTPSEGFADTVTYMTLTAMLYGFGEDTAASTLNASVPGARWAPMRYRLALRRKDYAFAARLRRLPDVTDEMRWDFNCTMGLHLIWRHRYKWGFHFYRDRYRAINFTKILPKTLRYQPITPDPLQDPEIVVLEQGVGEILLALMHLKAHPKPPKYIVAMPKLQQLCKEVLPGARFVPINEIPKELHGKPVTCAADLFGRAWALNGSFAPPVRLATPARPAHSAPLYGICWRGGSGHNRREERHIPLQYFLDLLPDGARYVPLQFDLNKAENDLLLRDHRCQPATMDVSKNPAQTLALVRELAGVISVDSANWHFCGAANVPLLALMNETPHWFWGPRARAEWCYDNATTLAKRELNRRTVAAWMQHAEASYASRPVPASPRAAFAHRPLLMAGLPRTGSSMSMETLVQQGLWTGKTVQATRANPRGFFENIMLKQNYVKAILSNLGASPDGVRTLPDPENLPLLPGLRAAVLHEIAGQGYDGKAPWGFKDPKLTLLWPIWARAFPEAVWVIPRRNNTAVINSLMRVSFMQQHSTDPHFWRMFCACYEQRLDALKSSVPDVIELDTDAVAAGSVEQLAEIAGRLGLNFDPAKARKAIDPRLFQAPDQGKG